MTEPILIASALLALGRFFSRGQSGGAARDGSSDPSVALPPNFLPNIPTPAPVVMTPPLGPLVLPPDLPPPPPVTVPLPPPPLPPIAPPTSPPAQPPRGTTPRTAPSANRNPAAPPSASPQSTGTGTPPPPSRPTAPSGTPPSSRPPAPTGTPQPSGALPPIKDRARLDRAAELARQVADDVKQRGRAYNRQLTAEFQRTAGLTADGIYGPKTAGAVKWYTGELVPPQTGRGVVAYTPNF